MTTRTYRLVALLLTGTLFSTDTVVATQVQGNGEDSAESGSVSSRSQIDQKLRLIDHVLRHQSHFSTRENAHNPEAQATLIQLKDIYTEAKADFEQGDYRTAQAKVDLSLRLLSRITQIGAQKPPTQDLARTRYNTLRDALGAYATPTFPKPSIDDIEANTERLLLINELMEEAEYLADKSMFEQAHEQLSKAYDLNMRALVAARQKETIIYALEFKSKRDEYEYELRRYQNYRMFLRVTKEQHKLEPTTLYLIHTFVAASERLSQSGEQQAKQENYPAAITMLEKATNELVRALRVAGVALP